MLPIEFFVLHSISIPQRWKEDVNDPERKDAMMEEMKALVKNRTWEFVDLPLGKRPVGYKWVFKVKHTTNGLLRG